TASNVSLQDALLHLKETQSQFVEAEKMASLGQHTAGAAHERNNPINFVSSNVTPLKRNIKTIRDTLDQVERIKLDPDLSAEAEYMAYLVQLSGGVAYEINSPIDFVSSNVAPL